jgi:hypothetical protein
MLPFFPPAVDNWDPMRFGGASKSAAETTGQARQMGIVQVLVRTVEGVAKTDEIHLVKRTTGCKRSKQCDQRSHRNHLAKLRIVRATPRPQAAG